MEVAAREAFAAASRIRSLPFEDEPEIRILPPAAFAAQRDAIAGSAAAGPQGDDYLLGLRALAGLGMISVAEVSTRGAGGSEVGTYDCADDVIRVADLRFLPPPVDAVDALGKAPPGWRDLVVSLHALLAHESVHALLRRTFDLPCPPPRTWPDRDAALAQRALEEGDAEVVLASAVLERATPEAPDLDLWTAPLERAATVGPAVGGAFLASFPYVAGVEFARALHRAGGNAALDEAYRRPPVSSEQVLHPERYFAGDAPAAVVQPDLPELRARGYAVAESGTIGEAGIVAFLSESPAVGSVMVVPLPEGLCDPEPLGCARLAVLPGSRAVPPGMTLGLELTPPDVLPPAAGPWSAPAEGGAGEAARPPVVGTENWALREEGALRPAAWARILDSADGWRGDTIAFWIRPDQDVPAVVWATAWDGDCDAEQFRREIVVARPAWAACRRGSNVSVVGGLPGATGAGALRAVADGIEVTEAPGTPFPHAYVSPPGRVEEQAVADLGDSPVNGWPARADAGASPGGATVLRRWVDEEAGVTIPLPAGPYWRVLPAPLRSPLARGVALERIGGGLLVVATVEAAAVPLVRRRTEDLIDTDWPSVLEEVTCSRGAAASGWFILSYPEGLAWGEGFRLLVDVADRSVFVYGWLPLYEVLAAAPAARASVHEFSAAFEAACGGPAGL